MNRCYTCGAVYADDARRPTECVSHVAPLDCAFNATQMDRGKTLAEAIDVDRRDD